MAAAHPAFICALTVGFIAFVIGLYRPQMFQQARGLVFNTLLSAVLSFPAVWVVSKALGLSTYWPVGYDPLRPVKIVLIWSSGLVTLRLLFLLAARWNLFVHRVALIGPADSPSVSAAVRAERRGFLEIAVVRPERASSLRLSRFAHKDPGVLGGKRTCDAERD